MKDYWILPLFLASRHNWKDKSINSLVNKYYDYWVCSLGKDEYLLSTKIRDTDQNSMILHFNIFKKKYFDFFCLFCYFLYEKAELIRWRSFLVLRYLKDVEVSDTVSINIFFLSWEKGFWGLQHCNNEFLPVQESSKQLEVFSIFMH